LPGFDPTKYVSGFYEMGDFLFNIEDFNCLYQYAQVKLGSSSDGFPVFIRWFWNWMMEHPLVKLTLAGWNIPMFNRKYLVKGSIFIKWFSSFPVFQQMVFWLVVSTQPI